MDVFISLVQFSYTLMYISFSIVMVVVISVSVICVHIHEVCKYFFPNILLKTNRKR